MATGVVVSVIIYVKSPSLEMAIVLLIALAAAGLNALTGMELIKKSVGRSQATFLKLVLGGMLIRLLCLGVIIALIYIFFTLHFLTFVVVLMVYYFALLFLEVVFIYTRANEILGNNEPRQK